MSVTRRFAPWLVPTAGATLLAYKTIHGVIAKVGHAAAPLDDTYIHFQYARAFAEGHPFRYQAGEPVSTGATSFLWPLILGVFHAVGFRGNALMWPAWLLAFAALAALAYDVREVAEPLAGRGAAIGAGAMTLFFGGLVWCAGSGMEVVPFAWVLMRGVRRGAEWAEMRPPERTRKKLVALLVLAGVAPLVRPEGAVLSLALGAVVAVHPREPRRRVEGAALAALAFTPMLLCLLLTGSARTSTAEVKLLFSSPYADVAAQAVSNARTLATMILDGEHWSAEFLPRGAAPIAWLGLLAVAWRGQLPGKTTRAALVVVMALLVFAPCFYVTFLWNRLRYLWPFMPAWFVGAGCLARVVAGLVARFSPRAGAVTAGLLAGACAGALAVRLEWVTDDVAQSASGIDRQQAALGRWAAAHLPPAARIGVNDTGAIAYFGDRKTFDVVGLTTPGEGKYWVAGAASRLEHYERIKERLPSHFIVYPEWMACEPVLGKMLHEAVVADATILGGQVMRVYEARTAALGSGDTPWTKVGSVVDAIDVADLESEAAHRYDLLGARDYEQTIEQDESPAGVVVDGGRMRRAADRFVANLPADGDISLVARVAGSPHTKLRARIGGSDLGGVDVPEGPWHEVSWPIPATARGPQNVEVNADPSAFTSFHYWIVRSP
jgi:hypothetical protein